MSLFSSETTARQPAVAGLFYPSAVDELEEEVGRCLGSDDDPGDAPSARAVIAPHAGYRFSGRVAGRAVRLIMGSVRRRVILIGPSHRKAFSGAALPDVRCEAFSTPLGHAALDVEVLETLRNGRGFNGPSSAHDREHCLEVMIPLLQGGGTPTPRLVPILIGGRTGREALSDLAEQIVEAIDEGTVILVSTDFSHHGPDYGWTPFSSSGDTGERLMALARSTIERAAGVDPDGFWYQTEVSGDTVCGRGPVQILLEILARRFEGSGEVLDVTSSGHLLGDFRNSVSYASAVFRGRWKRRGYGPTDQRSTSDPLSADGQRAVASLARATLSTRLGHGPELARWFAEHGEDGRLRTPAGAFVTLSHRNPEDPRRTLRACMGVMDSSRPMVRSVIDAAISAARDPRFEPVKMEELEDLLIEVSVLSPTRGVPDAESIQVGVHGVTLEKGGRRAVFLPHVATEQGWDRETMLDALARKAGVGSGGWRDGASFGVFTAQVCIEQ